MNSAKFLGWTVVAMLFLTPALPLSLMAQHTTYQFVDLGTLGGPNSSFNGSAPPMINSTGMAAGQADTSTPCPYPDPFTDGFMAPAFGWQRGVLANLGLLPGGCYSLPNSVNARGMIVGSGDNGVIDSATGLPEIRADFRYKGQIIDMGTFGGTNSLANSINDRGQATGGAENTESDPWNFGGLVGLPSPTAWHGFLWQNGVLTDLGTLGGPDSGGVVISQSGKIAGFSFTNSIANSTTGIPTVDPFLWDRGTMIDLGTLGGTLGMASSLNNQGRVVGFSDLAGDQINHAFFWDKGVMTDIGTLGGLASSAAWINDAGRVVGTSSLADHTHHAFVWTRGKMTDLGTVGSDPCSNGFFINASGQVVGTSTDCQGNILHVFLWTQGSMVDLNPYIPPEFLFVEPVVISDTGEIAGNGILTNGEVHAVVLKPVGNSDHVSELRGATAQNTFAVTTAGAFHTTTAELERTPESIVDRVGSQLKQRFRIPPLAAPPRN